MTVMLAIVAGVLTGCAVWLMLGRDMIRFLFGLILMGNAVNLTVFGTGGLTWGAPPLVPPGAEAPAGPVANALPQALVLTAIVIGLGMLLFGLVLVWRIHDSARVVDSDRLLVGDPEDPDPVVRPGARPLPADGAQPQ